MGQWFSFAGRISRQQYWLKYVLLLTVIEVVGIVAGAAINLSLGLEPVAAGDNGPLVFPGGLVSLLVSLAVIVPGFAGLAKRCHDRDRSGWFQLISLIPLIGSIWLLVEVGFLRGTPGPNRFGPDPLAGRGY
jgi:uncharacterized membrane protein YhaH (DUF805 family)